MLIMLYKSRLQGVRVTMKYCVSTLASRFVSPLKFKVKNIDNLNGEAVEAFTSYPLEEVLFIFYERRV